jgi:hypothetical protein
LTIRRKVARSTRLSCNSYFLFALRCRKLSITRHHMALSPARASQRLVRSNIGDIAASGPIVQPHQLGHAQGPGPITRYRDGVFSVPCRGNDSACRQFQKRRPSSAPAPETGRLVRPRLPDVRSEALLIYRCSRALVFSAIIDASRSPVWAIWITVCAITLSDARLALSLSVSSRTAVSYALTIAEMCSGSNAKSLSSRCIGKDVSSPSRTPATQMTIAMTIAPFLSNSDVCIVGIMSDTVHRNGLLCS